MKYLIAILFLIPNIALGAMTVDFRFPTELEILTNDGYTQFFEAENFPSTKLYQSGIPSDIPQIWNANDIMITLDGGGTYPGGVGEYIICESSDGVANCDGTTYHFWGYVDENTSLNALSLTNPNTPTEDNSILINSNNPGVLVSTTLLARILILVVSVAILLSIAFRGILR